MWSLLFLHFVVIIGVILGRFFPEGVVDDVRIRVFLAEEPEQVECKHQAPTEEHPEQDIEKEAEFHTGALGVAKVGVHDINGWSEVEEHRDEDEGVYEYGQ